MIALMKRMPWTLGMSLPSRFKLTKEATFFFSENVVNHSPKRLDDFIQRVFPIFGRLQQQVLTLFL